MKKPRRLTTSQERRLNLALSLDDLFYRKFERLQAELRELHDRLITNPSRIREVLALRKDGNFEKLAIERLDVGVDGTRVIVRL